MMILTKEHFLMIVYGLIKDGVHHDEKFALGGA